MKSMYTLCLLFINLFSFYSCKQDKISSDNSYKTENIVVILIDGPRYSETWGDSTHQYIPGQELISKEGVIFTDFYNDGITNTVNGHTAITTGYYENLNNSGMDIPSNPSIFQLYREHKKSSVTDAWIISSKDKLQVLGDCNDLDYNGNYNPRTDCGNSGLFTGYRDDSVTFNNAVNILSTFHPHFAFISFKQPDSYGHMNDWPNYLNGLMQSDTYALQLWQFLQSDPHYKNRTTVFITNDHGRHLDSVSVGFSSHGDTCLGCRQIMLLATGPDFKRNEVVNKHYGLIDINATIALLFGLKNTGQGKVIEELFN